MNIVLKNKKTSAISKYAYYFLVCLIWAQAVLLQYVRAVILRLPLIGGYADVCIYAVFIFVILAAIPQYKLHLPDLFFLFSVITVFLLEWLLYKSAEVYLSRYAVDFLLKALPLYIVGVGLPFTESKDKLYQALYYLSILTLILDIIYRFTISEPMTEVESLYIGNMALAYNLLPHCCLIAWFAVKKTNVLNVIFSVVGIFYLLMLGSRGPALIYLLFIAICLILGRSSKRIIVRILVIFGAIVAFINSSWYIASLIWMEKQAKHFGLSIRVFERLITGDALQSLSRDRIREKLLTAIGEKPLLGYGLCSDRVLAGGYAHNIVVEILVEFGVLVGTALLIALVSVLFKGYVNAKNTREKGLVLSLILASFFKLFLSGSYLDERLLFLTIGICIGVVRVAGQEKQQKAGNFRTVLIESRVKS